MAEKAEWIVVVPNRGRWLAKLVIARQAIHIGHGHRGLRPGPFRFCAACDEGLYAEDLGTGDVEDCDVLIRPAVLGGRPVPKQPNAAKAFLAGGAILEGRPLDD